MTTPSTPSEEEITFFQPAFQSDKPMEISGEDMGYLVAWMRAQLTNLPKEDENSHLCQSLTSILNQAFKTYGSAPMASPTCICRG
ncbi:MULTISPECIES: hypothetical protein [unclassified Streptomyces]|uniref:hypothetical protein n=1 Tax=unclassified Streptomyces TaxID=2593676 RepID=UPI00093DED47|nr:hypothetical protein [Streptomyces sp. TSRI0281]OKI35008.1 hypothetical protein A6A29_16425 [Streptomyces sp. TSRI0281]